MSEIEKCFKANENTEDEEKIQNIKKAAREECDRMMWKNERMRNKKFCTVFFFFLFSCWLSIRGCYEKVRFPFSL